MADRPCCSVTSKIAQRAEPTPESRSQFTKCVLPAAILMDENPGVLSSAAAHIVFPRLEAHPKVRIWSELP